jgi:N6-adenosine-specific RNA methylase IME4
MRYDILMIDPPWPKKKGGIRKVRPNQGGELDYETMSEHEIWNLLDSQILLNYANDRHIVFIWSIDSFLTFTEEMMNRMGYKQHARLIWDKENGMAPAFTIRFSHEYLLWYYKGKFEPISKDCRGKYTTVFRGGAREHSRKPDYAYEMIDKIYPNSTKIDVFSREKRNGWGQWGNQTNHFTRPQGGLGCCPERKSC